MWAVIPIKNVNEAKHRLASVLSPNERRELFVAMFEDVLTTVLAVPRLEKVVVATVLVKNRVAAVRYTHI